jgi:hypothetical protein
MSLKLGTPYPTRSNDRCTPVAKRLGIVLSTAILAFAGISGVAHGAPAVPGAQPVVLADAPAGEFCSFPVTVTALDGQTARTVHGTIIVTGPFTVTVTNTATGASTTVNASGPTFLDTTNGLVTQVGPTVVGQPASRNVGPAFLVLNSGRTQFTSNLTIASFTGKQTDLCAAVA